MISGLRAATRMNLILREPPYSLPPSSSLAPRRTGTRARVFCAVSYLVIPGHLRLDCGKNGSVVSNVQTNRDEQTRRMRLPGSSSSLCGSARAIRVGRTADRCSCSNQGNRSRSKFTRAPRFFETSSTSQRKLPSTKRLELECPFPARVTLGLSGDNAVPSASGETSHARDSRERSRPILSHRAENPQSKP